VIPKSLSASSILVSEGCLDRWKAEYFDRTPSENSDPAGVGLTFHFAAEHFVKAVYIDKIIKWDDIAALTAFFDMGYTATFQSANFDTDLYRDGAQLVASWYDRNKHGLPNEVVSCEVKSNFPIRTSAGEIPWNYIWDRADKIGPGEYEIVDYKSLRGRVTMQDMKEKIQPRSYAVAGLVQWPDAERIWVTFDMLRFNEMVSVCFTREECIATYRYMQRAAERIIAVDPEDVEPTINAECKWCIKKVSCEALLKNIAAGTTMGMDLEKLAERKLLVQSQLEALKYADAELDKAIMAEAEHEDAYEFEVGDYQIGFSSRSTRNANSAAIAHIVGPELSTKYGTFSMANIDKMLNSGELSPDVKKAVEAEITKSWSDPKPKVKKKGLV
jgi:hypothetical protein